MEKNNIRYNGKEYIFYSIKTDLIIGKLLKKNVVWGECFNPIFEILIDENTDVIDCGAFIGTFSFLMAQYLSSNNKVYSFEPIFYDVLTKNVIENNLHKIIPYCYGLTNKECYHDSVNINLNIHNNYGMFSFSESSNNLKNKYNCFYDYNKTDKKKHYIPFVFLDSFDFNNLSLIKIDVELFEKEVIEGSINTLQKNNYPSIFIELFVTINDYNYQFKNIIVDNTFNCFSILSLLGYVCIPVSAKDGDFVFIHKTKQDKINKIIELLNTTEIKENKYFFDLVNFNSN